MKKVFPVFACVAMLVSFLLSNHYVPWVSFYHEAAAFLAGLLLIVALLQPVRRGTQIQVPLVFLMLVLLATVPLAQYASGLLYFFGDALVSVIYVLFFFIMLVAGYNLAQDRQTQPPLLPGLAAVLIVAGFISAWLALHQWLLQPGNLWIADLRAGGRPYANLAQPNHLATLLAMALASLLYLYEKRLLQQASAGLLAVLFLFVIALSQSRTAWLMAVFFLLLWWWKSRAGTRRLGPVMALGWVALFACFVWLVPELSIWLDLEGLTSLAERAQAYSRWPLYTQFVHAIVSGPLWGYGWQQAGMAQLAVAPLYSELLYTEYTHNVLLDLLVWNGPLLGTLIILLVGGYLLRLAFLSHTAEQLFAVLAAGCFLLHALLEFPHAYAYFLLPVALLLGSLQASVSCRVWLIPRWTLLPCLIVAAGVFAAIWHDYRAIEEDFRLLRFEKGRIGTVEAEQLAPDVFLLDQLQAFTWHARVPVSADLSEQELTRHARVAARYSQGPSIYKYVLQLAYNGKAEQAYQQLQILRNLHGARLYDGAVQELRLAAEENPQIVPLLELL